MLASVADSLRKLAQRLRGDGLFIRRVKSLHCRLRYGLTNVHHTALVGPRGDISRDLAMAEFAYVGPDCIISPQVSIGAYTMLGPRVMVVGDDHVTDRAGIPITFAGRPPMRNTVIGKDVWIGCNSVVIAGISIGDGAIVAAGSVVTRDVAPFKIVGGVPARVIRDRFSDGESVALHSAMLNETPRAGRFTGKRVT